MQDKRDRAALFQTRLIEAMAQSGLSRSALARETGVNRSTISQLLDADKIRLPNAQLMAECARVLGVSTDWLLGLTDRPERPGDILAAATQMTDAARISTDDQLLEWHKEAAGYKIRHVPATLPDMLKTVDMLRWEYTHFIGKSPDQAIAAMRDRVFWLRSDQSEFEIAIPVQEIEALASGEGYYSGLSPQIRREQLDWMAQITDELFPSLRINLFDQRKQFSAPVTLFGPLLGVIYIGRFYMAFRDSSRLKSLSQHFDWLVREAQIDARDTAAYLARLRDAVVG